MDRRNLLRNIGVGVLGGTIGNLGLSQDTTHQHSQKYVQATQGLPPLTITKVKAISTRPGGSGANLVVVKVETSEPGLYGLGCATFTQRAHAVVTAVDK